MKQTWQAQLSTRLFKKYGKTRGEILHQRYIDAFPANYQDCHTTDTAINDISNIEVISDDQSLEIVLYVRGHPASTIQANSTLQLRLFQRKEPISLSNIMPMLDHFNLSVDNECQHVLRLKTSSLKQPAGQEKIWITNFNAKCKQKIAQLSKVKAIFQDAFYQVYMGKIIDDGFNKLILGAALSWQEVMIFRTYARYLHQVRFQFSQAYIENTLVTYPMIARLLIDLFKIRYQPNALTLEQRIKKSHEIEKQVLCSLEQITSLDEDKIVRRLLDVIKATVRTNYFQETEDQQKKPYLAIKLNSRGIPGLPLPVPLYEIFIDSPRFSGVHLRYKNIARGGIRYSDRPEDFRTEILALMKAQIVKNAIIVPSGAKGGFILKRSVTALSTQQLREEVIACYQLFINGLLDLTDNIINKVVISPLNVVCYDGHDPYLVVAADKGTATFSDRANAIAEERGFWENDSFASGGKTGYDHKKMGITAKGTWESIKRHFREINIDLAIVPVTVIGIGDMSGDVFGNGMLYSNKIKLLGAFNGSHIFVDPDPDPVISYHERQRLFRLSHSSWEDYHASLISKGGGVFKRNSKSIALSAQMKKLLDSEADTLTPDELIFVLLKAPVDLLFNGGIGTYVKASAESHADVNDRSNDNCRINGNELRCKVVGEGGNLGLTQLGRIEYAAQGGLINTDFIDNAAGVNCSDHEVNLKLLIDYAVRQKKLSYKKRNILLSQVETEIAALVLKENYYQALVMSITAFHSLQNTGLYQAYISALETSGVLDRCVEFLPSDKVMLERKAANQGLTRPELAILLAYTKISIKQQILASDLPEDPYLCKIAEIAFPHSMIKKYVYLLPKHRLYRDIIATQLSNRIVNQMSITFFYRLQIETGATISEMVRAFTIASNIFESNELHQLVESLDHKIPMTVQYEMLYNIRHLVSLGTRWFLHSTYIKKDLNHVIQQFATKVKQLEDIILTLMTGFTKKYLKSLIVQFSQAGLSKKIARRIATYRAIYTALNIIEISTTQSFDLIRTAKVYFAAGERFHLVWFRDQIANDSREGHWNALARLSLRDDLDSVQRTLTIAILRQDKNQNNINKLIGDWKKNNSHIVERWDEMLSMLHNSSNIEYMMFFIALREFLGILSIH